jgi:hypothetical protein
MKQRPNETQDQCRVRERTRGCKLDKLDDANRPLPLLSNPPEQTAPSHGKNPLFTEFSNNKVAKITTDGVVTESPKIANNGPTGSSLGRSE